MLRSFSKSVAIALVATGSLAITATKSHAVTTGNLLGDPSFENAGALTTAGVVLNPSYPSGVWGQESATITPAVGGVTPDNLTHMLSETVTGGVATQTIQWADVSAYSAQINTGTVTADYSADFNVDNPGPAAAQGEVVLTFFDSSHSILGGVFTGLKILDTNAASWQTASLSSVSVPVNTVYFQAQVAYAEATMYDSTGVTAYPGYVDNANLTLTTVPEPASLSLLGLAAFGMLRRTRRAV